MKRTDPDFPAALFFLAWRGFSAQRDALLAEHGLGVVHHRVLFVLVHQPGVRIGELADVLGISRQALHRTLAQLEAAGLIERSVPADNARERALHLAPEGRRLERRIATRQRRLAERALSQVDAAGRAAWERVMAAFAQELEGELPEFARQVLADVRRRGGD